MGEVILMTNYKIVKKTENETDLINLMIMIKNLITVEQPTCRQLLVLLSKLSEHFSVTSQEL